MAARIGALHVMLGLDSAEFSAGLKKASGAMSGFSNVSKVALAGVAGALAGLTGALSFGAVVSGTRDAINAFGDLEDAAKSAGLDVEIFQSLAYQAKLGGVEFNAFAGALDTFNKNSGLAVVNKGKMVSALKALNPELLTNIQAAQTQEQRVRLAADAIDKAATASEKAALATALFGDAGAKLAGVFAGGAAEIEAMMVKARQMGLIVDRDLIAKAGELGDQFDTTSQIIGLKMQKALIDLGPVIIGLIDLGGKFAEVMGYAAQQFKATEDQSREHLEKRLAWLEENGVQVTGRGGTAAFAAARAETQAQIAEVKDQLRELALGDLRRQLSAPIVLPTIEGIEGLEGLQTGLANVGGAAVTTSKQLAGIGDAAVAGIAPVSEALDQLSSTLASGFTEVFSSVIDGSKSAGEAVADLAKSLANMALQQGFQSLFGSIFGGLSGSFGGGGLKLGIPGFAIPGFANGTNFAPGGLAMVGERGPELVNLPRGSQVFPNEDLRRLGGGGDIHITINAPNSTSDAAPSIARQVRAVLPDAIRDFNMNPHRRYQP